jgi:acyl-CoA thioesterase I
MGVPGSGRAMARVHVWQRPAARASAASTTPLGVATLLQCALLLVACSGSAGRAGEDPGAAGRTDHVASLPGDGPAAAPQVGALPASPAQPAVPDSAPLVAFLGDSIAAGLHLSAERAFPARLAAELARGATPFRLLNAGVSGDTTSGGLRRVDWLLKQRPAVVVVELGANDGLRAQPVALVEQNLRAIVQRIRAAGAVPLLLGIRIPPSYGEPYVGEFAALYDRVAKDTGAAYVPFFMEGVAGEPALNLPDGIHPTAEGHAKLAARVREPLASVLAALPRGS